MQSALAAACVLFGALASCASPGAVGRAPADTAPPRLQAIAPLAEPLLLADTITTETVAPGVVRRRYRIDSVPWAIHVLDVDREHCWQPAAIKAAGAAVGRELTSTLVAGLTAAADRGPAAGGVNADFFSFAPPGVPRGAHIQGGSVVAGPSARPVLAVDSAGRIHLSTLRSSGRVVVDTDTLPVATWNRPSPNGLAYFDTGWGARTDTASGTLRLTIARRDGGTVTAVDTGAGPVEIPREGAVLMLGRGAPAARRARLLRLRPGIDSVHARVEVGPFHPREAVGGSHVILRSGLVSPGVDTAGGERFGPFRHPRTAAGVGAGGRRLLLVVVDGRQPGYSEGMTLRELAETMRDLGAEDAINLDGGGSSALVVMRPDGTAEVVNRPSDATGERAVANALAVAGGVCGW